MAYKYFSHNGFVKPATEAVITLDNIEYSYGFGVYETIRVSKGKVYFPDEHCHRLIASAEIIGLEHTFSASSVQANLTKLLEANNIDTCNLKVLLIGGSTKESAALYIMCLNPLFPDRKLYKNGVSCVTYKYEREFPGAKTLNMLSSYLAYRQAKQHDAYDALLINRQDNVTEGTRTNFFVVKDRRLISPKQEDILLGVTRNYVIKVAGQQGFEVIEQDIPLSEIDKFDGAFLTSTPIKIMPIRSINDKVLWETPAPAIEQLIPAFNAFLDDYAN